MNWLVRRKDFWIISSLHCSSLKFYHLSPIKVKKFIANSYSMQFRIYRNNNALFVCKGPGKIHPIVQKAVANKDKDGNFHLCFNHKTLG